MTAIPATDLEGEGREKALERLLYAFNGQRVKAIELMDGLRIPFEVKGAGVVPHTSYVEFVSLLLRVARFFGEHGYSVHRSGGTPFHEIWIEQVRSS